MDQWVLERTLPVHLLAASGLVYDENKKILLLHSKRGWEFPGGVIEQGETVIDGLKREILEETGYEAEPYVFTGVYQNLARKEGYGPLQGFELPPITNFCFLCRVVGGESHTSEESDAIQWVSEEEARRLVTFPTYDKRLFNMLSFHNQTVWSSYYFKKDQWTEIKYNDVYLWTNNSFDDESIIRI
ncbi:MAG: NUDIX hydrolase [Firmicutes bacterium]|nr:NUDIX hydrolase [Bacillota bacterium]